MTAYSYGPHWDCTVSTILNLFFFVALDFTACTQNIDIILMIRPKEKYASFPITCPNFLGSVGRQTFFFIKTFLYGKSMKILKNSLKIDFNIPKAFKKV